MQVNALKKLDWMAVVFYPLAVVLMEAFWVAPWLNWLGQWPMFRESRPVLSLGTVVLVLALALVITRISTRLKMPLWAIQTIVLGSGLLVTLLVFGYEYADGYTFLSAGWFTHAGRVLGDTFKNPGTITAAIPVIIYLWWRGISMGQSTSYFKDIYRTFLLGMVALIVLIIIWQMSASSGNFSKPGAGLGANVIAFFFFGLIAIAICQLYLMRNTMPREEAALTSVWRWMPIMLGVIGGVVLIGFGIASALSPSFFETISHGAAAFGHGLEKVFYIIIYPLNYLAEGIMWLLRWIIRLLRNTTQPLENTAGNMTSPFPTNVVAKDLPPWASILIKWLVATIVIGLVIWILARTVGRFRARRAREEIEEVRESLFSWKGLRDDLKLFFNMMGQRFKRKEQADKPAFDENDKGPLDIREIYRHLQWEAGKVGVPRRRHETPDEYALRLKRYAPDTSEPLTDITAIYKNVRYGEKAVPEQLVDSVNSVWRTLQEILRKMRGE